MHVMVNQISKMFQEYEKKKNWYGMEEELVELASDLNAKSWTLNQGITFGCSKAAPSSKEKRGFQTFNVIK